MSHGKPDYFSTLFEEDFAGVHGALFVTVPTLGQPQMFRVNVAGFITNVSGNATTLTAKARYSENGVLCNPTIFSITLNAAGGIGSGGVIAIWNDQFNNFEVEWDAAGFGVSDTYDAHVKVEGL